MNSSQAKEKDMPENEPEEKSSDPFASDIFADARLEENPETELAPKVEVEKPAWVWRLQSVSRQTVDWNALWGNLPADFSADLPRRLADALAGMLDSGAEHPIEILFLIERETNEIVETEDDSWWLNFGFETSDAVFAVQIDDVFAVWLVDATLGEKKSDGAKIRELTPSEIAVLEFLAVNLTHDANEIITAPLFKFRGLSRKIPVLTNRLKGSEASNSMLVANWQTVHGFLNSIVKIYVTPETLKALNAGENNLLTAAPRRRKTWTALENRLKDVRARLFFGDAQMTLADAAGLETGDVVLLKNNRFLISGGELAGKAEIFLGDGAQTKIVGAFISPKGGSSVEFEETSGGSDNEILVRGVKSNRDLQIIVESFEELDNPQTLEKSMSNEEIEPSEHSVELGEGGIALENLAVTLRVELEARRLSLAEIGNLRINQIIELGTSAADPVNLLIDDKIVARGELVEVENRLGVRIIQILR